jgi:rhamnogalacturonan endolyase
MKQLIKMMALCLCMAAFSAHAQYQMEYLKRGVVSVRNGSNNFVSWRWLGTEDDGITFNLYRDGTKVNNTPLTVCNYTDNGASATAKYSVKAVIGGVEQASSEAVAPWAGLYKSLNLNVPPGGTTPKGEAYTYSPNDCSVGDVDADGEYEIFVKWDPSNSKDNSQKGYTGNVYIDCYKLSGTQLWRIDLGRNIRAGAHYTQFLVYDFDGDGKAEMACKTADGTKDGKGVVIGSASADFRNSSGYVLSGPEFLTVFNGQTGAAMATASYTPARGTVSSWGDSYGNRVDRFIAAVVYLDGKTPSMVFGRGYYTRLVRAAWDWKGGKLTQRWIFDSNNNSSYRGQGNHQMTVGDVDGDGKQELCNGASIIDDNGAGLYPGGHGHGDALHMSDMDPDRPGLEIWQNNEEPASYGNYGLEMKDAKTGKPVFGLGGGNQGDIGRSMAADIDPRHKGYEMWGAGKTWNCKGQIIYNTRPSECFGVYWDGDLQRELLDGSKLEKWDYINAKRVAILTLSDAAWGSGVSCNTTKATPNLAADIFGDWREEIILHSSDNKKLLIYTTYTPSEYKFRTLMHDPQYRVAISWQNSAYNQPPHLGYYLGGGMTTPSKPNIVIIGANKDCNGVVNGGAYLDACGICVGGNTGKTACVQDCNGTVNGTAYLDDCGVCVGGTTGLTDCISAMQAEDFCTANGILESKNTGFMSEGYLNLDNAAGTSATWYMVSEKAQTTKVGIRYANGGTSARTADILVNGTKQTTAAGAVTGGWTTWKMENVNLTLQAGVNKIQVRSVTTEGAANLDEFVFGTTSVIAGTCIPDCHGDTSGTAFIDACGICAGGKTGKTSCVKDCNGDMNGTAKLDVCGNCVGGNSVFKSCSDSLQAEKACSVDGIALESKNAGFSGEGYINTDNLLGASADWMVTSSSDQMVTVTFRYSNGGATSRNALLTINGVFIDTLELPNTLDWTTWEVVSVNVQLKKGQNQIGLSAATVNGLPNLDILYMSAGVTEDSCIITGTGHEQTGNHIKAYPNPFRHEILIGGMQEFEYELYDAKGVHLKSGRAASQITLGSDLSQGIYTLRVIQGNEVIIQKLVKE